MSTDQQANQQSPSQQYCLRLAQEFLAMPDRSAVLGNHRAEIEALVPWTNRPDFWSPTTAAALWSAIGKSQQDAETELCERLVPLPQLQVYLSALTAYTPSKWLVERELVKRQSNLSVMEQQQANDPATITPANPPPWAPSWNGKEDVYNAAGEESLTGLCFSGGGIRSATFNLGVLQGLATRGLLPHFDYLSSVSGGGYIHQWLAAWILRSPNGLTGVQRKLVPRPADNCPPNAPEPIFWLRRYASYLTPQRGMFSADTWTMIAIWFRNTLLNQIVLFSFLGALLFLFHFLLPALSTVEVSTNATNGILTLSPPAIQHVHWALASLCALSALLMSWQLAMNFFHEGQVQKRDQLMNNAGVVLRLVIPGLLLGLASTFLLSSGMLPSHFAVAAGAFFLLVNLTITYSSACTPRANTWKYWRKTIALSVGALATAVFSALWVFLLARWVASLCGVISLHLKGSVGVFPLELVFLPPLLYSTPFLAVNLQVGLLGRDCLESRREWLARLRAWTILVAVGWLLLSAISLLSPGLVHALTNGMSPKTAWTALLAFLGSHAAALYSGASKKTDGTPSDSGIFGYKPLDLLGIVAAPIAIASLLVVVSWLLELAIELTPKLGLAGHLENAWLFIVLLILLVLFGWRVDVNEFSLHGFYRNRLARCYLGASLEDRAPDPFTGFDERSEILIGTARNGHHNVADIRVSELLPKRFHHPAEVPKNNHKPVYTGPFPIFSCTLNLTSGEDLAYQERKGASFAFTPLYSGYHVGWTSADKRDDNQSFNGFVPTKDYAYNGGVHLATAAAISGAAMSPNQGYSTKASLAFLMTLFNVRLGWWIANPRRPNTWPQEKDRPTPTLPLLNLLNELFGAADDSSDFVYLNDGGKFDNMGLYELVRRRCRYIVVCDAEQDGEMTFDGIAMAIRKCRTDFGAEITLDLRPLEKQLLSKKSTAHVATGTIRYPPPPFEKHDPKLYSGVVVYIKSSLTGDEPADVISYAKQHDAFPHDMTTNQWFTESQFESYRTLGEHILSSVFAMQPPPATRSQVEELFTEVYEASEEKAKLAPS